MSRSGFISYIEPNEPQLGFTICDYQSLPVRYDPIATSVNGKEVKLCLHPKRDYLNKSQFGKLIRPIRRIKTRLDRIND